MIQFYIVFTVDNQYKSWGLVFKKDAVLAFAHLLTYWYPFHGWPPFCQI